MPNRISAELAESPKALPSSNILGPNPNYLHRTLFGAIEPNVFCAFLYSTLQSQHTRVSVSGCDREVYVFRRKKTSWADPRQHAFHQYTAQFFGLLDLTVWRSNLKKQPPAAMRLSSPAPSQEVVSLATPFPRGGGGLARETTQYPGNSEGGKP